MDIKNSVANKFFGALFAVGAVFVPLKDEAHGIIYDFSLTSKDFTEIAVPDAVPNMTGHLKLDLDSLTYFELPAERILEWSFSAGPNYSLSDKDAGAGLGIWNLNLSGGTLETFEFAASKLGLRFTTARFSPTDGVAVFALYDNDIGNFKNNISYLPPDCSTVPLPPSALLMATGLGVMAARSLRRRKLRGPKVYDNKLKVGGCAP